MVSDTFSFISTSIGRRPSTAAVSAPSPSMAYQCTDSECLLDENNSLSDGSLRMEIVEQLSRFTPTLPSIDDVIHGSLDHGADQEPDHFAEFAGDFSKWSILDQAVGSGNVFTNPNMALIYFLIGGVAALIGCTVQEATVKASGKSRGVTKRTFTFPPSPRTNNLVQLGTTVLEGGVLLEVYKGLSCTLAQTVPEEWNKEFFFRNALEKLESMVHFSLE